MDKLYDVTALGEMLIDFTMNGQSDQGTNLRHARAALRAMYLLC